MSDGDATARILVAIGGLGERFESLDERVESKHTEITARFGEIDARFRDLNDHLDQIRTDHISLGTAVMDRIDRVQNDVTALRDDVGVNFGRSDYVERISRAGIDEMRLAFRGLSDQISGMHRQIHRLEDDVRTLRGGA